jgi:hypothetical protein
MRVPATKPGRRLSQRAAAGAFLASVLALGSTSPAGAVGETVNVNPDSNLPDTASVNISASGFTPNRTVSIFQCADVSQVLTCSQDPVARVATNSSGFFPNTAVQVKAVFVGEGGGNVECRTACRVLVEDDLGHSGEHAISFTRFASSK